MLGDRALDRERTTINFWTLKGEQQLRVAFTEAGCKVLPFQARKKVDNFIRLDHFADVDCAGVGRRVV